MAENYITTKWDEIKMEGYSRRNKQWNEVIAVDLKNNQVKLATNGTTFLQAMDQTELRINKDAIDEAAVKTIETLQAKIDRVNALPTVEEAAMRADIMQALAFLATNGGEKGQALAKKALVSLDGFIVLKNNLTTTR